MLLLTAAAAAVAALRGVDVCGGRRLLRTFKIVCAPAAPQVMFAVMIEGLVFMAMSALDVRRWIMKTFPRWLMSATMAGIGLFLAQIGLHGGNGIDLVRDHPAIYVDAFNTNIDYSARTWLGIFMFFLMGVLRCEITREHPRVPESTRDYPRVPESTREYPRFLMGGLLTPPLERERERGRAESCEARPQKPTAPYTPPPPPRPPPQLRWSRCASRAPS